ncbi:MAG: hypothetical protein JNL81_10245 [Hyphomonadaceae bacterium]|nr:hypothetical protein [Hyphomonadaceae bacterium]
MPVSREEVRRAFAEKLKTLSCPHCGARFTEFTAAWNEVWSEGRRDALHELKLQERDGPVKLKCGSCGGRSMTNVFLTPPAPIAAE